MNDASQEVIDNAIKALDNEHYLEDLDEIVGPSYLSSYFGEGGWEYLATVCSSILASYGQSHLDADLVSEVETSDDESDIICNIWFKIDDFPVGTWYTLGFQDETMTARDVWIEFIIHAEKAMAKLLEIRNNLVKAGGVV